MTAPNSKFREASVSKAPPSEVRNSRSVRRRIAFFVIVIPMILLAVNGFVCATWSHFLAMPGWLKWQLVPAAAVLAFIPVTILGRNYSSFWLRLVYAVSAVWLGILNFCFFASIACWIVAATAWLIGWAIEPTYVGGILFGLAFLASGYGLLNAAWTRTTRVTLPLPNLPAAWEGHTLALVTDLHLGHLSGPVFLRRILSRLRSLQPDAVLISGDMFDGTMAGLDRLVAPWREFTAPRGVYYVTGNHEEFSDRSPYLEAVKRTGIRVLNNEKVSIDGLQIVGVHDSEAEDPDVLRLILRQARLDPSQPSILLAHKPENLPVAEEEGISLQLSGHTHRGQIWPWSLLVSRIYGRFAYGLNRLGKLWVYTSSGAGTWGPPLRVGTKSEIVLIRFERESPRGHRP